MSTMMASREAIFAMTQDVIKARMAQGADDQSRAVTYVAFEELLVCLLMTFDGPIDETSLRATLRDPKDLLTSPSDLNAIPDGHLPLVVVRQLLSGHRVTLNSNFVFGWSQLVARYGKYIL